MAPGWRRKRRSDPDDDGEPFDDYDDPEGGEGGEGGARVEAGPVPRLDLWLGAVATVLAACAAAFLPEASVPRLVLSAPAWLFLPGYLLLQAILLPVRPPGRRLLHAVAAIGLSPPLAGLLALSTLLLPGGLRAASIVTVVTLACLALAIVAGLRRTPRPAGDDGTHAAGPGASKA